MPQSPSRKKGPGELVVVGCGIQLGRHITRRAISEIRSADRVFCLAEPFALHWVQTLRSDCINLAELYGERKDRRETYDEMVSTIVSAVVSGWNVCALFYGHPGVFTCPSHAAISRLRERGYNARMEPGISAEACLYADLGIDPGQSGVQSFEATQFLAYRHTPDPGALLLLWQVALAGNLECIGFDPRPDRLQVLVDKLAQWYRPETEVILYEAARLPVEDFRADRLALADLPQASYQEHTTLVIPPAVALAHDEHYRAALRRLD